MTYFLNRIEHRWARRFRVNIPVRATGSSAEIDCQLGNLSLSGALLESAQGFRLNSLIEVHISLPPPAAGARVKGHVTRKLDEAVAIEWCEFAPQAVKELLRSVDRL
jgi:hypothetical protein